MKQDIATLASLEGFDETNQEIARQCIEGINQAAKIKSDCAGLVAERFFNIADVACVGNFVRRNISRKARERF